MQRLALLAAGSLVALMLGELGLALLAPQVTRSPRVWQFDPDTGWANRPGARGRLVSPEFDVELAINAEGVRGPEVDPAKPAGALRVAIFGDSFAQGWGVAEDETLRAQLEARLRKGTNEAVEVLGFGVAGYGIGQSLLAFRKLGRRFAPDVVVLVVYGNDLWDDASDSGNGGGGRLVSKPRFQVAQGGGLRLSGAPTPRSASWDAPRFPSRVWFLRIGADIAQRSHVATLVSRVRKPAGPPSPLYYERIYARHPEPAAREAWLLVARLIGAFDEEARAAGARFVLLYASDAIESDAEAWSAARAATGFGDDLDAARPGQELGRIARQRGIAFVDLRPLLRTESARGPFFFRERHWNANGHALAADALAAVFAP